MNFSFKRFIPKAMQDTKWGSLTEVWQSIYTDIRDDKIKAIFEQYDFDNIAEQELRDLAVMLGFSLKTLAGYTSTLDFIKKQVLFIVPRLKVKTTALCYQLQGIPYNLLSNGYTSIYDSINNVYIGDESLITYTKVGTIYLDRENDSAYSPSFLDFNEFPYLDGSITLYTLSRNIVFNYTHKFIESATEFQSLETLKVLNNDINQFKRVTDRCYYEPYLHIDLNNDHSVTNKTWTDYQGLIPTLQKSILIDNAFSGMTYINFGSGVHSIIDTSITNVQAPTFQLAYSGVSKIVEESGCLNFRTVIQELQKFSGITEVALLDSYSGCILYSTFPKVQWDPDTYSNIKFNFQII